MMYDVQNEELTYILWDDVAMFLILSGFFITSTILSVISLAISVTPSFIFSIVMCEV